MMTMERPTRRRVRRCSWATGVRCHAPATRRVRTTYLDQPTDRDVLFCDRHAEQAPTLLREGWAIASVEPLADGNEGTTD